MNPRSLRSTLILSFVPVLLLPLWSCSDGNASRGGPQNVINIGFDASGSDCIQRIFPPDQPDVVPLPPPIFLLTGSAQQSTVGQAEADPGDPIPVEVTVNSATRRIKVELANAWSANEVIFTDEVETRGSETVSMTLMSRDETRGRYFMRLTLCGLDCDEREVVFDLTPCTDEPDDGPCGPNGYYQRTLVEDGEVVQVDGTCIDLGTTPGIGSGTIAIR